MAAVTAEFGVLSKVAASDTKAGTLGNISCSSKYFSCSLADA